MTEKIPHILIVTRTKDRPTFLARAIRSVASQSYGDYTHLIINDGGDPGKVDHLIDKLGSQAKVIHNAENIGMEASSNKAIASIKSDYISIHDDDDTWHPECVEYAVQYLESNQQEAGVVVKTDRIDEQVQEDGEISEINRSVWMPDMQAISVYRQFHENQMTPITFIFRRSAYDDLGGYDERIDLGGDWDFGIRFVQRFEVGFLDPGFSLAGYHHRIFKQNGEGNTSYANPAEKDKHIKNHTYIANKYLREDLKNGSLGAGYIIAEGLHERLAKKPGVKRFVPEPVKRSIKKSRFWKES